ncbi:MAG: PSD1 and planctomycete cytochrome C domain-containing protein [Prosthecobacter sp.]|uniref:PSD1 and planctomycete cytochrome C domain-containing protein n=1 Tax=Prosthecobacter sp. TaxID=1965333 RepID=UPI0038FFD1CA
MSAFRFTPLLFVAATAHAAPVDFVRDVQPLFAEHCLECHGPDDSKGGLVLTSRELALKELKSGAHGIIPGKPEQSEMIARLVSDDPEEQMPPPKHRAKHPLKSRDIEVLQQWIAEGAKFVSHWAYKPISRPKLPSSASAQFSVLSAQSSSHPVDLFVRTKLAEKGITPSPEADPITLIRRVTYDLHGLPPTPEEVDAFVAEIKKLSTEHSALSTSAAITQAYESLLDRLLSSERFGERWGRHWLDMARYADSDGYEKDRPRPDAWRFRDWVIRAINDDLPFDQFTIEQLAGDLLPEATPEQIVATAFNRQTLTNTEGGTDQEQFRIEACMDRTETLGTVWLGLTVGCARCHTHKYDQITQKEYYQLFAYFNNGDEVNRQVPTTPEAWTEYEKKNGDAVKQLIPLRKALDAAKAELPVKLPEWEKGIKERLTKAAAAKAVQKFEPLPITNAKAVSAKLHKQPDGSFLAQNKTPKTDSYTLEISNHAKPITALQIEVMPDDSLPGKGPGYNKGGNFVLTKITATLQSSKITQELILHSAKADFEQKTFTADKTLDTDDQTGWAVSGATGKKHTLTLQFAEPVILQPQDKLTLRLDQNYKQISHTIGRFRILAASEETEDSIAPEAIRKILSEEPKRRNPVVILPLWAWMEKVNPAVVAADRALKEAEANLPKQPVMDVRVIGQRVNNPRKTNLLYRGDFLQPADEVTPASLATLPPLKGTTRLDLARWLVSKNNPLTPRVTVNHFWNRLFGEGLVRTVADFGVRGEPPTHPELLDWLADEFIKQGWSRKKLLKTIMLSATYRQSSAQSSVLSAQKTEHFALSTEHFRSPQEVALIQEIDPRNTLLWRQNRLRVDGEIVRDLYLAAGGLLSAKIGGPSVFPPIPEGIDALSYAGNFKWTTSKGEDRYRRGMYTFFKRTAPHPDLTTFDCPDANTTNVKRTVSNTPLQALTTLNAEAFAEAAQALSKQVLSDSTLKDDVARLTQAFRLCVSRLPDERELTSMQKLLTEARYTYQNGSADDAKAAIGSHAVLNVPAPENAAWVATTRIVLNLDEFITRE